MKIKRNHELPASQDISLRFSLRLSLLAVAIIHPLNHFATINPKKIEKVFCRSVRMRSVAVQAIPCFMDKMHSILTCKAFSDEIRISTHILESGA